MVARRSSGIERVSLPARMEPPDLPTETLAAEGARAALRWVSPVPPRMRIKPLARAISLIRAENPQTGGLAGGASGIRTGGPIYKQADDQLRIGVANGVTVLRHRYSCQRWDSSVAAG